MWLGKEWKCRGKNHGSSQSSEIFSPKAAMLTSSLENFYPGVRDHEKLVL